MNREARSLLARAVQIEPTDFRTYLALDDSRRGAPGYPSENDLNTLLAAAEYAPQVTTTRFRAARALVDQGIFDQAIGLLAPVANDPHAGSGNRRVRALLEEARSKAGLAPLSVEAPPEPPAAEETPDSGDTPAEGPPGETTPDTPSA